jgi:hypothetical protein
MATFPTFTTISQRVQDLIGQPNGTISDFNTRNINNAVNDILNRYPFSWNLKTTDLTLASGTADMPSDWNPKWGINDARIEVYGEGGDSQFTEISIHNRDSYGSDDYVYWLTVDVTNNKTIFNTHTQSGTVTIYYNFVPTDMSTGTDVCVVPDTEAVAYLAASKNWIGAERDTELKREYEQMAKQYIDALYFRDLQSGPDFDFTSLAEYNLSGE